MCWQGKPRVASQHLHLKQQNSTLECIGSAKHAFKSMRISQKVVDNIEVMRKCGVIDFVLNQKVVSSFFYSSVALSWV
jgi:hypothetical protein